MSQKLTKMTIIAAVTVSLSGCAQINAFGDNMWGHTKNAWGYTKSAANFVASPVTKLLRSAPEQHYVFEDASRAQNMAKQAFLTDGHSVQNGDRFTSQNAQHQGLQTPDFQAPAYLAHSYQKEYDTPSLAPSRVVQAQLDAPLAPPQTSDNISFVKMGGGSDMQDWVMCETEAGGFIRVVEGGYLIDPGFESCMRAKGYKPESEISGVIGSERTL